MSKTIPWLAAAAALALSATAAHAQRGASITLYDQPNFQGNSVTITQPAPDLGRWRFNDRAMSARIQGRWLVCEHDNFKGRCQELTGGVDLNQFGLAQRVSSLEPVGGRPGGGYPGGGYPGGPGGGYPGGPGGGGGYAGGGATSRGFDGTSTVFFARPQIGGVDVAASERGADVFCRRAGLGRSVWFDSNTRNTQAVGPDGELVGRSEVIRDLLCRKY